MRAWLVLLLLLVLPTAPLAWGQQPTAEMRGMWVTRFEWPSRDGDAEAMRARIADIMRTLRESHFNAVFFQVRGQAEVFYPSEWEPWSPAIGGKDPGFDPLAFAIEEARKNGLEFHAYVNPFPVWNSEAPPEDPEHPFHQHPDWFCVDASGKRVYSEYYYFSPGNPEVQAYLRKVILDIVERYPVDGIHLDRIRYPSPSSSHDAVSKARFAGPGNPRNLGWEDWQREQITRFVYDLYGQIQSVKPQVKLSAAVWGIFDRTRLPGYGSFSSGFHQFYQDSFAWVRNGAMDALVPMIYWPIGGKPPHYDELYKDFVTSNPSRHVYGGTSSRHAVEAVREIVAFTRSIDGPGTVVFSTSGVDRGQRWSLYQELFEKPVPVPPMPWKEQPTAGVIVGRVLDEKGEPVTDAWIRMEGLSSTWLSSGDGRFAILNVPPGGRRLIAAKMGLGKSTPVDVEAVAGRAATVELVIEP